MNPLNLQRTDTQEDKFALAFEAAERPDLLPPVYILSHNRVNNFVTFARMPWLVEYATVVVVADQLEAYRAAWPKSNIIPIPRGYGGHEAGIGRALMFILEMADMLGQDHIITVHDDLKHICPLYNTVPGQDKVSMAYARVIPSDLHQSFYRGMFTMFAAIAAEAYAAHPDAVIASPQVNQPDRHVKATEQRWVLNQGGNPAQLQSWRVDRYLDQVGPLNLEDFNFHGEDISIACDVVAAGCQIVDVPSIMTGWLDYELESVIRDPSNAHILRQGEHDALMKKTELVPYIKTRTDILDRPQWHSMNWAKLKRDGVVRTDSARWDDPMRTEDDS